MQYAGHLLINNEKIKVLVREHKTYRSLKIRQSESDGNLLTNESIFLEKYPSLIKELKNGSTVHL